jgi:hypothetical protein
MKRTLVNRATRHAACAYIANSFPIILIISGLIWASIVVPTGAAQAEAPEPAAEPIATTAPARPTRVAISARLLGIDRVSDPTEPDTSFDATYWIEMRWTDPRLAFAGGQTKTFVQENARGEMEKIWDPDMDIENEDGEREFESAVLTIAPNGAISYQETFKARIAAEFDLRSFPFDVQHLVLAVVSDWNETDMIFDPVVVADIDRAGAHPSEWLPATVSARVERRIDNDGSIGSAFVLDATVRRDGTFYLVKLILPLCVVVVLSWSNFWITGRGDGRIRLTFLCLLAVIAYENVLTRFLPRLTFLTFMDWIILVAMASLSMTVAENAWVHALLQRGETAAADRIDRLARRIIPAIIILGVAIVALTHFA